MEKSETYVALALLTQRDLDAWGIALRSSYPIVEGDEFAQILEQLNVIEFPINLPNGKSQG